MNQFLFLYIILDTVSDFNRSKYATENHTTRVYIIFCKYCTNNSDPSIPQYDLTPFLYNVFKKSISIILQLEKSTI